MKTLTLEPLPFAYDALEPYMDKETLHFHHDKHHQAYLDKYNELIMSNSEISDKTLDELLSDTEAIPASVRQNVINQGGGVYNHNFFWSILGADGAKEPTGALKEAIDKTFGSFETFKAEFSTAATLNFGSGWTWLVKDALGNIKITSTKNQDCPISFGNTPLLTIDTWEHAYYLQYQNRRPDFITAFWNIVNWSKVSSLFEAK